MFNFLVKLANLLDDRGQHAMAREVDDLIEKLAQAATSYTKSWLDSHRELIGLLKRLKEVVQNPDVVKQLDDYQGSIEGLLDRATRNQITANEVDWSAQAWEEFKGILRNVYNQIPERTGLREAFRDLDLKINQPDAVKAELPKPRVVDDPSNSQEMSDQFDKMNPNFGKPAPGVGSKAPAQPAKKPAPNKQAADTIRLIQNALVQDGHNIPVNGKWDPATNKAFIEYMNRNYPLAMKDNVFVGLVKDDKGTRTGNKLTDAWELIKEKGASQQQLAQEMANKPKETGVGSKAPAPAAKPAAPAPLNLTSKYFKLTPELRALLGQWEAARGKGTAQTLLDTFDRSPGQTTQSLEAFIKENMNA